jgi:hypothetical protein
MTLRQAPAGTTQARPESPSDPVEHGFAASCLDPEALFEPVDLGAD